MRFVSGVGSVQVVVPLGTVPPISVVSAGMTVLDVTSNAGPGPRFATCPMYSMVPPGATLAGPVSVTSRSACPGTIDVESDAALLLVSGSGIPEDAVAVVIMSDGPA